MKLGIDPPKGVLCYGPPGTGKTLLARAVANRTDACFIRVIGSELVQKYVGEGARMVRELFQVIYCQLSFLLPVFLSSQRCYILKCHLPFSLCRWHGPKKLALCSLTKLTPLVVLDLMTA